MLLCATRRGLRVLQRLRALLPDDRLDVVSFREEPHEPPFLDDIASFCATHCVAFREARRVEQESLGAFWDEAPIELLLAVSWRYIIDEGFLARPQRGAWVFHDSLLPKYRGFSPTVWAIMNGEQRIGVTLARMVAAVDAGPIADQERCADLTAEDTIATVIPRIDKAYLALLERNIHGMLAGSIATSPQDHETASYGCRRVSADNEMVWSRPTRQLHNLVRAVSRPYPGAFTWFGGALLRVWAARVPEDAPCYTGRVPGRVVDVRPGEGIVVLTGDGSLLLTEVQLADGAPCCPSSIVTSVSTTLGRTVDPVIASARS